MENTTFELISQMVSIAAKLVLICFMCTRFKSMKYSIWHIFIRYVFYRDTKPIQWLSEHIIYLLYLVFSFAQFTILIGLIHQLRSHKLYERLPEFAYSSPISSISLTLIFIYLFATIDGRERIKLLINTFKITNNHGKDRKQTS